MPNGGVPIHMILFPKDNSPYVLYDRDAWDREGIKGKPLSTFTAEEGAAVAWFLKYWLGDDALQPGYTMRDRVNAKFDF